MLGSGWRWVTKFKINTLCDCADFLIGYLKHFYLQHIKVQMYILSLFTTILYIIVQLKWLNGQLHL